MLISQALRDRIKTLPLVREWRDRRFGRRFLSPSGFKSHYGVFASFAEARAFLPPSKEFNHAALAQEYIDERSKKIYGFDYPVIHWMGTAFRAGARSVFDIGGAIGTHYYSYQKVMEFPPGLVWRVAEVPEVVELGRQYAQRMGAAGLEFTASLDPPLAADIWLSAGAIHYIEDARPSDLLARCPQPPAHFILNKLPLYDGEDFVSAQNLGDGCFAPHHVYNRRRLIADVEARGYRLVDAWDVHERQLRLPDPRRSFARYSGLYFARSGSRPGPGGAAAA